MSYVLRYLNYLTLEEHPIRGCIHIDIHEALGTSNRLRVLNHPDRDYWVERLGDRTYDS